MSHGLAAPRPPRVILDREAYLAWYDAQPRGRFERVAGERFAMAPERAAHLEAKAAVWPALRQAVAAAGVGCRALPDGATIRVGDRTDCEPDAVVHAAERTPPDGIAAPEPLILVEALSPSIRALDTGLKLSDDFRAPRSATASSSPPTTRGWCTTAAAAATAGSAHASSAAGTSSSTRRASPSPPRRSTRRDRGAC